MCTVDNSGKSQGMQFLCRSPVTRVSIHETICVSSNCNRIYWCDPMVSRYVALDNHFSCFEIEKQVINMHKKKKEWRYCSNETQMCKPHRVTVLGFRNKAFILPHFQHDEENCDSEDTYLFLLTTNDSLLGPADKQRYNLFSYFHTRDLPQYG